MRDFWYKECEKSPPEDKKFMENVNKLVEKCKNQDINYKKIIQEVKEIRQQQDKITYSLASQGNFNAIPPITASGAQIMNAVYSSFKCLKCGALIINSPTCLNCPFCGFTLR